MWGLGRGACQWPLYCRGVYQAELCQRTMFNEAGLGETAASPRFLCAHSQWRHISHDHDGEFSGEGKDLPAVYLSLHVPWSCGQCRGVWEGGYPALLKDGCLHKMLGNCGIWKACVFSRENTWKRGLPGPEGCLLSLFSSVPLCKC